MPGKDLLLKDNALFSTAFLTAGGTSGALGPMDLGNGPMGQFDPQRAEFRIEVPAMSAGQFPVSSTLGFNVYTTDIASYTSVASAVLMQTLPPVLPNSGGGTSQSAVYFKLPIGGVHRYLFVTTAAGSGTAATSASVGLTMVF